MRLLTRIAWGLERAALALSVLALLIITAAMAAQVIWRYLLEDPLRWSEAGAVFALVWLVFLGAAELVARDVQVSIPTLVDMLPRRGRAACAILARLATLAFAGLVVWLGLDWLTRATHTFNHVLGLSTLWVKIALPLGASFMVLFTLRHLARDIRAFLDAGRG
ncbi:MAG: TRAP transporter small permease [Rhodobacteraceae bacterium]|nr:TRAP transporter small permease [Paracoccaceae bacterium]